MTRDNNQENNIEQQVIDIFKKAEPTLLSQAQEVLEIQEQATNDFKKAQVLIKEELIKEPEQKDIILYI